MKKSLLLLVIIGSVAFVPKYSLLQDNIQHNSEPVTFSQTVCRTGIDKTITDFNLTRDTINLSISGTCILTDVNIRIDTVIHSFISDLVVRITKGSTAGSNFIGTRLNDSAVIPIASGNAPFTGEFRPESPLSGFNFSTPPGGNWILSIRDTAADDTGVLRSWCLTVTYDCGDPVNNLNTEVPSKFSLEQNYPNPFNPVTKIKFGIPVTSGLSNDVKLIIYDALGKEVVVLVNEKLMPGNYETSWNASSYPSGVYYYKLVSGGYSEVKKMVLVK
jgi:subtilisin-like proprotein convertase family protein